MDTNSSLVDFYCSFFFLFLISFPLSFLLPSPLFSATLYYSALFIHLICDCELAAAAAAKSAEEARKEKRRERKNSLTVGKDLFATACLLTYLLTDLPSLRSFDLFVCVCVLGGLIALSLSLFSLRCLCPAAAAVRCFCCSPMFSHISSSSVIMI